MKHMGLAVAVAAALVFAGCTSGSGLVDPAKDVKPTGRTIRLKASVEDYFGTQLYPGQGGSDGLRANLWAFCFAPLDANDEVSANAIEHWSKLENDGPELRDASPDVHKTCSVPGPTIRVKQGDMVEVVFSHSHVHPHTIHWHGQYVPQESDGVPGVTQDAVKTGESFTYRFMAKRAGTLWYHCHVDTQLHVMQGLYGMFIVEPQDETHEPKDIDREYNMVLSTVRRALVEAIPGLNPHNHPPGCFTSGTPDCQNPALDTEPDVFLINGHSFPLTMEHEDSLYKLPPDGKIRLRILNAGNSFETLHPHGQDMLVTHRDGNPLLAPFYVDTLSIGPAERYDVVIEGTNPGAWVFHTHVNQHEANDGQVPGGMHTMIVYDGFEDKMHTGSAELAGGRDYEDPIFLPGDQTRSKVYSFGTSAGIPGAPVPTGVSATWTFDVDVPCGLRYLRLNADLSGLTATPAGSQITLTVEKPNGQGGHEALGTLQLGRASDATAPARTQAEGQWNQTLANQQFLLPEGEYRVRLSGTALEATVHMQVLMDYYASWDEQLYHHRVDGTPRCGDYGRGTSGLPYEAPPV